MFDNIGSKIKSAAKVITWIGIIIFCLVGLIMIFTVNIFLGLVYAVIGSFFSWFACLAFYGFGELIEKTTEIANNIKSSSNVNSSVNNNPSNFENNGMTNLNNNNVNNL